MSVLAVLTTGAGFREDEIQCDHAAAHLIDCCPELNPRSLECTNVFLGCGSGSEPWLTIEESECIRSLDCREIAAAEVCDRVARRIAELKEADGYSFLGAGGGDAADVEANGLEAVCP